MEKFLGWIERTGNKLPHPFWLFFYLTSFVLVCSLVLDLLGVSVTHPVTKESVTVLNLLSKDGLQRFVLEMVTNFSHFAPLGLVLVMLMGVSLAVHTGLLETLLARMTRVPATLLLPIIVVTGIMGNLASDAGIVIVPPLAAVAFRKAGLNPMAGIVLAYASCTAGFTATVIPRGTDVLLAGFTNQALEDPNLHVGAAANLYFMIASVLMLALVMAWVGKKFTIPACGAPAPLAAEPPADEATRKAERRGLAWAMASMVLYSALALATFLPEDGLLRYDTGRVLTVVKKEGADGERLRRVLGTTETALEEGRKVHAVTWKGQRLVLPSVDEKVWRDGATVHVWLPRGGPDDLAGARLVNVMPDALRGPFFRGMVAILFFFFAIPGIVFGVLTGKIAKLVDIPNMMTKSVKEISGLVVLVLVMAHFVAFFQWSRLDRVVAIAGANVLNDLSLQGSPLLAVTVVIVALLNIFLGSSAAKWAMLAPIMVPMFLFLENPISPAVSQLAYRIGDSITNGISPLYPYFPVALAWIREYRKDAGIGTLIRLLLPYALFAGIAWILMLVLWHLAGIPVGPGEAIR
jgi:aminobenzoyl-glutamate transport protein